MKRLFISSPIWLFLYYIFVISGISLSIPIQVIPDETTQLLNIYGMIQNTSLALPYESYYTVWVHLSLLPFTLLYWGVDYILQGLPNIYLFKQHVAINYMDVLPFLRSVSTLFFLISTWLVSRVVKNYWGEVAAFLFILFILTDLLLFINLHYSKHWIVDISWVFISIYLYCRYLKLGSIYLFLISVVAFSIGVYSSHPLIVAGMYPLYMLINSKPKLNTVFRDLSLFLIIFLLFLALSIYLGPGKIIGDIYNGWSTNQMGLKLFLVPKFTASLYDYNPLLTIIFSLSLILLLAKRKLHLFILFIPFLLYLLLISSFHYEPRYSLFLVISMSLVSAIVISKIKRVYIMNALAGLVVLVNVALLLSWHSIAVAKDTRIMTLEWLQKNTSSNSFVMYNTLGFNYHPITKGGINFINKNFPNAIGTRERLHLSLDLSGGINGIILRKIDEGGYKGPDLIRKLLDSGYDPILTNERFGENAQFNQPAPGVYYSILKNCSYSIEDVFLPYEKKPDNFEEYGDILYNFTNVIESLILFDRPGPIMTIYKFNIKQPETCS